MGDYPKREEKKLVHGKLPSNVMFMTILTWFSIQEIADDELNVTRILAVFFLLLFLWRYLRKSSAPKDTLLVSPLENKWREDIGNKIKDTKEIAAACFFLVSSFYVGYNAFYFALAAYVVMRLVEYLLLESKVKILENVLAIAMIAGFFIAIMLWVTSDFFSPVLAILFLLAFCIVFIVIFWIYGFDRFLYRISRARGRRSRKY
jgi:hypothetical protein